MTLLNPIWLWALGGLSIPVAIHLLSRKEGKTIRIGSIRFLTETSTSKFSSIRLNEVVLLALRSLLVILIVLFLAGILFMRDNSNSSTKWVVIEKGLENNVQIQNLLDSLQKNQYEVRMLAKNFPLPENDTITQPPDYYRLSEQLEQKNNLQAIVIASNALPNFKGKRISSPGNITWLSYPIDHNLDSASDFIQDKKDSLRITIVYDKDFQYDKKIMVAALNALRSVAPSEIIITEIVNSNFNSSSKTDWVIWLSDSSTTYKEQRLQVSQNSIGSLISQQTKNSWALNARLNEETALKEHLSIQLMHMLFKNIIQQEISKQDKRTVNDELIWSTANKTQIVKPIGAGQSAEKILILLIIVTFITERILAFYRKQ